MPYGRPLAGPWIFPNLFVGMPPVARAGIASWMHRFMLLQGVSRGKGPPQWGIKPHSFLQATIRGLSSWCKTKADNAFRELTGHSHNTFHSRGLD